MDAQLPARAKDHRPAFSQMPEEFESILHGQQGCIDGAKHRIDLLHNDVRRFHSAPYRSGSTVRKFDAAKIGRVITENIVNR